MTVAYPGDNGPLWNGAADWVSPNANGRRDMLGAYWGNLESPIVGDGAKVILYDTDHLCGICGDHKWLWKSFTRGLNPIFMDPYGYDEFGVGATDFRSANETQEGLRRNMGYLLAYADRLDLAKMEPRGDLCSTGYCLADPRPGGSYLVYLPQGGPVSVSLPVGSARLVAEWFDPVAGTVVTSGPIETEGSVSFEGPWKGEAVLFIHAAGEAGRGE
jgi:hypothetical protein